MVPLYTRDQLEQGVGLAVYRGVVISGDKQRRGFCSDGVYVSSNA